MPRVIPAALRLDSVQDLVAVVRSAGGHGVSLYPISTGHNWLARGGVRAAAWLPGELGGRAQRYVGTLDKTLTVFAGESSQIALRLAYWRGGNTPGAIGRSTLRETEVASSRTLR